ncbi:polyketide cyclase [Salmonella enterica subsp. enterica]|uniref:Polyketide cyclase n=1 Tax=Salmonella enterica subsp. enterica serovar Aqua TaxID=1302615 RepID=A0A5X6ERT8_SALET|nr:polyketide cyclase [Salmonella enterica subsp. enterica serovar Aqua]ECH1172502.1 polyketide cyclase [Salmonella enterica subsp. enterica serovar Aqua]
MWSKTYSKKVTGVQAENVWKVWTDINQWHMWQPDIEYAKLDGDFRVGNTFKLKPKSGPAVSIELIDVEAERQFTDLTRFPGARMYGSHELIPHGDELEIRTTMSIEGFLSFMVRIYGHSRFCNTDTEDIVACMNLSGV